MTQPTIQPSGASGASGAAGETLAEVRAHDRVMRYRRSGSGTALLLLLASGDDLWPELVEGIAAHYRVVVPELPHDLPEVPAVLRSLLDGIGAHEVPLIAAGRYCDAALELALGRNEFVGRVVLVPELIGEASDIPSGTFTRPPVVTLPLCVLSRDMPAADALRRAINFLGSVK